MAQKITPHLWYDREAVEAAEFYVDAFGEESVVRHVNRIRDTPSGDCDVVGFTLLGFDFMAISAGPHCRFTPAITYHARYPGAAAVEAAWEKLIPGGKALMPLGEYPFAARFGWLEDRYGLSWQIIQTRDEPIGQRIVPALMFTGDAAGKAEKAAAFYSTLFGGAGPNVLMRYGADDVPDREGTVRFGEVELAGMKFAVMDSAHPHGFGFNEAVSLLVSCEGQDEIDRYWTALSAVPEAEQCGWLKDRFGVSWQITARRMGEWMASGDRAVADRVTQAFLKMKKIDIVALEAAAKA